MFKKSTLSTALAIVVLGSILSNSVSAEPGKDLQMIPVIVNGLKVKFPDTEPYINTDGRTMVPVRFVSEKLGAEVKWEVDTQTAVIDFKGKIIRMPVGSNLVTVDGQTQELDTAAEFQDGRTMVPLRFVSEVLGSNVEWDEPAHSVRVTDAEYQAKVDSGEVKLDPWGREYKGEDYKYVVTDLEADGFYEFNPGHNSEFLKSHLDRIRYEEISDILSAKIRSYYEVALNIDYRTISAEKLTNAFMNSASTIIAKNRHNRYEYEEYIKEYVAWVKQNKVIAKGYADPESFTTFTLGNISHIPTHFKFMVISADDTSKAFMDGWQNPEAIKIQKGVWYDGYSMVHMDTNIINVIWGPDQGLRRLTNISFTGDSFSRDYKSIDSAK
ncbi:stalk domain-containing protein [Cohnella panacarvi]|uniref:stalk domain-containing protein n=1 Tax=Cohnella panacarvi TaxID=400776 RepID=UPI000478B4A6|nr:stalk domain-containing protein [Cohnella panacarvi]